VIFLWNLWGIWIIFVLNLVYIFVLQSFQSKLSFSSKEIVALSCSWCKTAYHNKESCFNLQKIGEECNLGKSAGRPLTTACQCARGCSQYTDAYASLHVQRVRLNIRKQLQSKWNSFMFCYMPTFFCTESFLRKSMKFDFSLVYSKVVAGVA
jgi:hypothetical protein